MFYRHPSFVGLRDQMESALDRAEDGIVLNIQTFDYMVKLATAEAQRHAQYLDSMSQLAFDSLNLLISSHVAQRRSVIGVSHETMATIIDMASPVYPAIELPPAGAQQIPLPTETVRAA